MVKGTVLLPVHNYLASAKSHVYFKRGAIFIMRVE